MTSRPPARVLVTSAGIQARGALDQLAVQDLRACPQVSVAGTWLACRWAARFAALLAFGAARSRAPPVSPGVVL